MRKAGGELYGISSEAQTVAGWARTEWELNFETIGDPHHEIIDACRERGWIDLFVNERVEFLSKSATIQETLRGRGMEHPKGFFQPGVLAVTSERRVLYRWRGVPNRKNLGGAMERTTAGHVWTSLESSLKSSDNRDAPLDTNPPLDSKGPPWVYFVLLSLASGWFLRIDGFQSERHVMYYQVRSALFIAGWIVAFVYLPLIPVASVLAAWVLFVWPKVRWLGQELQNETEPTPD